METVRLAKAVFLRKLETESQRYRNRAREEETEKETEADRDIQRKKERERAHKPILITPWIYDGNWHFI